MRNLFSKRAEGTQTPRVHLSAIWYVDADAAYSVVKRNRSAAGFAAVRTLAGQGVMELRNGKSFLLSAGSLGIFEKKQVLHYAAKPEGWQFYWFEFSTDAVNLPALDRVEWLSVSGQEISELEQCFLSLGRGGTWECMAAESLFSYLLADWQLRINRAEESGRMAWNIVYLLEKGRREKIGIAELAREAGMCERSFRAAVHEATGLSPKAYMLKGEMAAAMELLCSTDMTVSEIAASFNYSSPFYFSRVFKRAYGLSPQQERERINAQNGKEKIFQKK